MFIIQERIIMTRARYISLLKIFAILFKVILAYCGLNFFFKKWGFLYAITILTLSYDDILLFTIIFPRRKNKKRKNIVLLTTLQFMFVCFYIFLNDLIKQAFPQPQIFLFLRITTTYLIITNFM